MESSNTDSLRTLAPSWTLAGDDMLLTLLQNTHQRILSKCQEVNTKLDEMTSSLDDASIHLQNVNNKFMSLSNRQFIESRVYDDDADLETQAQINMESPKVPLLDEINMIKNSLAILESKHETAEIIDESDSDSDMEISVVLKPRDVYSDRPLPYIIGSLQWRNKWHAGLITETSDTDSTPSKRQSDVEYSDSEVEDIHPDRHHDNTISESSSLQSDHERGPDCVPDHVPDRPRPQPTAAEIAANIASVMARTQPLIERPVTPPSPVQYVPTKPPAVYKPTQPVTSRVFPDEPPPLEDFYQYTSSSSQEDIFAEINKNKPYNQGFKVQSGLTEDLFGKKETEDVFGVPYDEGSSYFKDEPSVKQKPPIKEQIESKSVEQSQNLPKDNTEENITKKPVGGISLFGSNKHTDTIGAAILKRNIRKSSTSDESESDVPVTNKKQTNMTDENQNIDEIDNRKEERDIFDDLFAKSNAASNKNMKVNKKEQKTIVNTEKKHNKDLFSDNIFDDVDDIFSSDIKIPSKSDKPSLFDDDDDLFSDVAKSDANVSKNKDAKPQTVKTKLFDSDDELFSDIKPSKMDKKEMNTSKIVHPIVTSNNDNTEEVPSNTAPSVQSDQTKSKTTQPITTNKVVENIPKPKAVSIFDSDSDDDIFNFNKSAPRSSIENSSANSKLKTEEVNKFQSPSLFDDDEIDELFVNKNDKVDNKTDSNKVPVKEEFTTEKQEQKKNDTISNEVVSKIRTSVPTDALLSENDKGKSALNIGIEGSKLFETNIQNKETDKHDSDVSNNEKATFIPEAQSSKSIETLPTSNAKPFTPDVKKLNETKAHENKISFNANDLTNVINSENSNAKETLLPKAEVPIFNEHLFGVVEPPPFEATEEPIGVGKKTPLFENPIENIVKEIPETPISIFNERIENITDEKTTIPILEDKDENISIENSELPTFEDHLENLANEIPPEVPLFDAIVTEPPVFEKTKEPKKSKNVNALFDDDSEDEALFFKKNDVISDEKPDVFSNAANFGLFADEPPPDDFENDLFGSKHDPNPITTDQFLESDPILKNQVNESNKINQTLGRTNNDLSSITEVPRSKLYPSQSLFENDSDEDIFSFNKASTSKKTQDSSSKNENNYINIESDQISAKTDSIDKRKSMFSDLDDNLFTTKTQHTDLTTDNTIKKDVDTKNVGKLTTNLNINVQALVPGASPKKTKLEKVETESKMVKHIDTEAKMVKSVNSESKMMKSISFEDEPESEVLDNNASKQRAKIQVKRRPSSRKARHEAVRKSAINLDHNIEQNFEPKDVESSTNFDNSPKIDIKHSKKELSKEELIVSHEKLDKDDEYVDKTEQSNKNIDAKTTVDTILQDTTAENINKIEITQNQNTENQKEKSTKVVYVLNDEDIFTNPIQNDTVTVQTLKSNEVFTKTNEISTKSYEKPTEVEANPIEVEETTAKFEETTTKVEEKPTKVEEKAIKVKEISTKVEETASKLQNPTKPTKKVSLFDSDDDEADDLFKTKPIMKQSKNTKLFDSDSEDDLFSKKRPNVKEKDKMLKKSLFDDDDADDDLFGAKPKGKPKSQLENIPKSSTSKAKSEKKKEKPKTIFADPLSLFGDDDDD